MALAPDVRIGAYQIATLLGTGGMGEVYQARDTRLDRDVALKVLPATFANDADRVARFRREAKTLAALNHPHIAQVYGLEEADGTLVLAMELIEGEDLSARLARGPMPVEEVLGLTKPLIDALDAAHSAGIVHRDLKPANLKLRPDGTLKVLDFGLAKAVDAGAHGPLVTQSPTITTPAMTEAGMILGTAAYMSPEQARGKPVDKRTDIWAFGCVVYELLTGTRAFEGETVTDVLSAIVRAEPDWTRLPADSPTGLRLLLRQCLTKDPRHRLRDLGDASVLIGHADGSPPSTSPRSGLTILQAIAVGVAVAALTIAGTMVAYPALQPAPAVPSPVTFDFNVPVLPGGPPFFAISPNGQYVVVSTGARPGRSALWMRRLNTSIAQPLPGTEGGVHPFWSADSRFVAYFADNRLWKLDLQGGPPTPLSDAPSSGAGGTWNREDVILFADLFGPLMRTTSLGGTTVAVTKLDTTKREIAHRHPMFLPDGNRYIFTAVGETEDTSAIYLGRLGSSTRTRLLSSAYKAAFAPPHWLVFVRGSAAMVQQLDLVKESLVGEAMLLQDGIRTNMPNSTAGFTVSTNGVIALRLESEESATTELSWVDESGAAIATVGPAGNYENPRLSPDGTKLAFVKDNDIWIRDIIRGTDSRFTSNPSVDNDPVWSADSSRIVFRSTRGGRRGDLYQRDAGGNAAEAPLFESDGVNTPEDWSRDGHVLFRRSTRAGTASLWLLRAGDKEPQQLLSTANRSLNQSRIAPDNRHVAYVSNESGRDEVLVQRFPDLGDKLQISINGGNQPYWRGDGRALYFVAPTRGQERDVLVVDLSESNGVLKASLPKRLFSAGVLSGRGSGNMYDVTRDGRRFLLNRFVAGSSADTPVRVIVNWLSGLGPATKDLK